MIYRENKKKQLPWRFLRWKCVEDQIYGRLQARAPHWWFTSLPWAVCSCDMEAFPPPFPWQLNQGSKYQLWCHKVGFGSFQEPSNRASQPWRFLKSLIRSRQVVRRAPSPLWLLGFYKRSKRKREGQVQEEFSKWVLEEVSTLGIFKLNNLSLDHNITKRR